MDREDVWGVIAKEGRQTWCLRASSFIAEKVVFISLWLLISTPIWKLAHHLSQHHRHSRYSKELLQVTVLPGDLSLQ